MVEQIKQPNKHVESTPGMEKSKVLNKTESDLNTHETSVGLDAVHNEVEVAKSKNEMEKMMKEDYVKKLKTLDDVEKATEKYGKIMDTYGVDTVIGWFPGGDLASGIFSTFFLLYQAGKLPEGQKMPFIDKLKIFGLQAVDSFGKPVGKIGSGIYLAAQGAILGMALGPIGAVVGGVAGGVGGYMIGGVLFDYFFKANKRSANIFKKHCDKVREEAVKQGMAPAEVLKLEKDQSTVSSFFGGGKKKETKKLLA